MQSTHVYTIVYMGSKLKSAKRKRAPYLSLAMADQSSLMEAFSEFGDAPIEVGSEYIDISPSQELSASQRISRSTSAATLSAGHSDRKTRAPKYRFVTLYHDLFRLEDIDPPKVSMAKNPTLYK